MNSSNRLGSKAGTFTLGLVADDVLVALVHLNEATSDARDTESLHRAAELFEALSRFGSTPFDLPVGQMRSLYSLDETLDLVESAAANQDVSGFARQIHDAIRKVIAGTATSDEKSLLARVFERLAEETLTRSESAWHPMHANQPWTLAPSSS